MGKLKIYGDVVPKSLETAADAVYSELGQKINLYADFSVLSEEEIRELNNQTRSVDAVTDVLSYPMLEGIFGVVLKKKDFPLDYDKDEKALFLGSIAICEKRAIEQAESFGHSVEREMTYLFVHGLLHLFGYDHMTDEDKKLMREKEEKIMTKLGVLR